MASFKPNNHKSAYTMLIYGQNLIIQISTEKLKWASFCDRWTGSSLTETKSQYTVIVINMTNNPRVH